MMTYANELLKHYCNALPYEFSDQEQVDPTVLLDANVQSVNDLLHHHGRDHKGSLQLHELLVFFQAIVFPRTMYLR